MGSKTQAALVWTDSAVELYAETAVDLCLTIVVYPSYTEFDNSFGLSHALQKCHLLVFGMLIYDYFEGLINFFYRLKKLGLVCITLLDTIKNFLNVSVHEIPPQNLK